MPEHPPPAPSPGAGPIPGPRATERRGAARTAVVWESLVRVLDGNERDEQVVLDIGGGTGGLAVRVAGLGHRVGVIDPSPDALAALDRRAQEHGVADRVSGRQGDLSTLFDLVDHAAADVVLCHGVLEIVEDPSASLATIAAALRPGGVLSLLVNQRHAAVIARAMAGHFQQARAMLEGEPGSGGPQQGAGRGRSRRFTLDEISALLLRAGFEVTTVQGVRVFADLVPSSLLDLEPGAAQALVDLEHAAAGRSEYLPLATQLHLLATRT